MTREEILAIAKPILFNTKMVRAILTNCKSVTRRVVRPQLPGNVIKIEKVDPLGYMAFQTTDRLLGGWQSRKCKYILGDILYVRETWAVVDRFSYKFGDRWSEYIYRATYNPDPKLDVPPVKWHPSIHMPKEATRIFLRVTNVRVERLQDITEEQAKAEGAMDRFPFDDACDEFHCIWNKTIKKADRALYGWDANPWIWVIEFESVEAKE